MCHVYACHLHISQKCIKSPGTGVRIVVICHGYAANQTWECSQLLIHLHGFLDFLNIYFYFVCMSLLPTCMNMYHIHALCLQRQEENVESPGSRITVGSELSSVGTGNKTWVSVRSASTSNYWAITPVPQVVSYTSVLLLQISQKLLLRYLSNSWNTYQCGKSWSKQFIILQFSIRAGLFLFS